MAPLERDDLKAMDRYKNLYPLTPDEETKLASEMI
jgi:hypothetical protein